MFWNDLSFKYDISYGNLVQFKKNIREELWTGKISIEEFWIRLRNGFHCIENEYAQQLLHSLIKPLPAVEELSNWKDYANIHLLSNHRIEWVQPIIAPIQDYLTSITISSETGYCKPHREIYLVVKSQLSSKKNVFFVDDQEKNFTEASKLGWNTILADNKGEWTKKIPSYF